MIFKAKNFGSRAELEKTILAKGGIAKNQQEDHSIEGTREDLRRLHLDDVTTVFAVKVVISDKPTTNPSKKAKDKPKR